ncbi:hypothetical protein [Xylanimonas cellulosilytica]|uniref:hypothetical protein n=1 Tax=Xylanimonas cellulosilytica TaxID=186189 RepID=UPI00019C04BA|nr:hypothetical protein [Xylanimonas cellulosilytica]
MTFPPSGGGPHQPGVVVVPVPADAAARAALTARVTTLTGVRHPHLAAVVEVRTDDDGALGVVHQRGEAADLPAVLAVRGRLAPGEAAAVGVHVAQALAALHAAGLAHGPLEAPDVVLRPGGSPALRPRATVPPEEWTPAEDVRAAARLVDNLLGSRPLAGAPAGPLDGDPLADPDGALRGALAAALGADARRRPEAGTLAALIDAACEPTSVRLPDPATLAGAALAGLRRGQEAAAAGDPSTRRFRATRTAGARARRDGSTGARPRTGRVQPTTRRVRGWRGLGMRRAALRPALVVAGIGVTVGAMTGAALEFRDDLPWAGGGASVAASDGGETVAVSAAPSASAAPSTSAAPSASAAPSTSAAPSASAAPMGGGEDRADADEPGRADATLDRGRPEAAAVELTQRRLDVLAGESDDLASVDVAGSPAHEADTALLAELRTSGTRPEQPRASVTGTTVVSVDDDAARVRIEYVVEAHEQVADDGTRTAVPASGRQTVTLELRWTDAGWRVATVA